MLTKLYKYEFAHIFQIAVWFYAILTISTLSVIAIHYIQFTNSFMYEAISYAVEMVNILCNLALVAGTFIVIAIRYYQAFLTDQSYLTFSLPVKTQAHFNCKFLTSIVFSIANLIMILLQTRIVSMIQNEYSLELIFSLNFELDSSPLYYLVFVLLVVVCIVDFILAIYFIMTLGAQFKNRFLGISITGIALYAVHQLLSLMWLIFMVSQFGETVVTIFATDVTGLLTQIMAQALVVLVLESLALYITSLFFFCKKKNLQ